MASAPPPGSSSMGWVGPAIQGGAALGGAVLGGKGQKAAAAAGERSTDKALAFQREQAAQKRAEFDRAMELYKSQWEAWNASRNALLQRYGVDIAPPNSSPASAPMAPPMAAPAAAPGGPAVGQAAPMQGATIGDLAQRKGGLEGWNDWNRYGLA